MEYARAGANQFYQEKTFPPSNSAAESFSEHDCFHSVSATIYFLGILQTRQCSFRLLWEGGGILFKNDSRGLEFCSSIFIVNVLFAVRKSIKCRILHNINQLHFLKDKAMYRCLIMLHLQLVHTVQFDCKSKLKCV